MIDGAQGPLGGDFEACVLFSDAVASEEGRVGMIGGTIDRSMFGHRLPLHLLGRRIGDPVLAGLWRRRQGRARGKDRAGAHRQPGVDVGVVDGKRIVAIRGLGGLDLVVGWKSLADGRWRPGAGRGVLQMPCRRWIPVRGAVCDFCPHEGAAISFHEEMRRRIRHLVHGSRVATVRKLRPPTLPRREIGRCIGKGFSSDDLTVDGHFRCGSIEDAIVENAVVIIIQDPPLRVEGKL